LIVDLDELNIGELFEVRHERARDGVERTVGLTIASEVNVRDAIRVFEAAVACKAVQHEGKPPVAFHIAGTFEKFVQHRADEVL
jgi:hypothetical protein